MNKPNALKHEHKFYPLQMNEFTDYRLISAHWMCECGKLKVVKVL